jgi:TP901 family phage tail tape measure protein
LAQNDIGINISTNADEIDSKIKQLTKTLKQLEAQNKKAEGNISSNRQRIQQIDQEINADKKLTAARKRKIDSLKQERASLNRSIGGLKTQIQVRQRNIEALKRDTTATRAYGDALDTISKPALRYALYDVSNSLRRISVATAALAIAPVGFAIKYEREFANVVRTSEIAGDAAEEARNRLLTALRDINQATPISWNEITDIATLAGQLGVASNLVADFTDNVAKFSATTDLTVDAAATAFGRLSLLIDNTEGKFAELGSAILAVGVDSIATESQIVAVATNIASMGNLAQLSAADIIGLSGSLASLGIKPELARGTVTRLFSEIGASVAEGGFELEEFARLSGRTAEEFSEGWGTSQSINLVLDFFDGLGQTAGEAERTLRELGITSVRDIPALLRLAQNSDEVRRLVELSNEEFVKATKIQEQYAIIAGTTAEELRRLGQNFELLLATVGQSIPGLAQFFSALSNVTAGITDFLATTPGQVISGIAIALALVVSIATGAGAVVASLLAGFSALVFASRLLGIDLSIVGLKTLLTTKGLQSMGLAALTTNSSFRVLFNTIRFGTLAFGALGVIIAIVGAAFSAYGQRVQQVQSVTNALLADQKGIARALQADSVAYLEVADSVGETIDGYTLLKKAQIGVGEEGEELARVREEEARAAEEQTAAARELLDLQDDSVSSSGGVVSALDAEAEAARRAAEEYLILGDNIALYLRRQVSESPEIQTAFEIPEFRVGVVEQFGDVQGLVDLAFGDPEEAARRAELIIDELKRVRDETNSFTFFKDQQVIDDVINAEIALEGMLAAANPENINNLSDATNDLNSGIEELEAQSALAAGEVTGLLEDLFGAENAAKKARDSVGVFFDELADGADASDITAESFQNMIAALAGNESRSVIDRLGDMGAVLQRLEDEGYGTSTMALTLTQAMLQLAAAAGFADAGIGNIPSNLTTTEQKMDFLISKAQPLIDLFAGVGAGADESGKKMSGAAKRAKTLAEQFNELADSMFAPVNAAQASAKAIADLGESYGELGEDAFFASSEIQNAVSRILASSGSAEEGVANLNALYARLAQTVGSSTAPSLAFLRNTIDQVANSFGVAANATAQATVNLDFFSLGARKAQQEVRTLSDFAGDLDDVISRAFDIRFASTFDIDRIADAWYDLGITVEDARFQVEELIASQQDLGSDRALKEYFLSVAEAYNDTLRAAQLRKEISDLDRQQAENARELAEAQAVAGGELTGQGPGQRQNRAALLDLVQDYQGYITTLAESGASQDELREATERARREFIEQARELGFQESVVLQYAEAFDDVAFAINNVPRNITVEFNANPALQALNELNAKLNDSIDLARELNRVSGTPTPTPTKPSTAGKKLTVAEISAIPLSAFSTKQRTASGGLTVAEISKLPLSAFFAEGGFTGPGARNEPAGIVHRGEYVIPKQFVNQSSGMPDPSFLAQLQNGMRGYQVGGFVGGPMAGGDGSVMVELSPYDRKLLENAGNVQLRLNGRVVAEATNSSNLNEARRGSN